MLVIGNLSNTRWQGETELLDKRHLIGIPDFHTGHLGFIPGISILVSGPHQPPEQKKNELSERTCEIIVTPHVITRDLLQISCTFDEKKGVVERLVNLMSFLNVNIVTQESATLFQSRHHTVNMIVDLSASIIQDDILMGGEKSKYIDILPHMNVSTNRGLLIFLHIVSQCHQILTWKPVPGLSHRHVPEIQISEFNRQAWTGSHTSSTEMRRQAITGTRPTSFFSLAPDKAEHIATLLGLPSDNPFHYVILSDTEARSLRIQFFQSKHTKRLIEIGFKHKDEIGALDAITRLVARSNFNVLSSLVRKIDEYHNVWEVLLQYKGRLSDLKEDEDPRKTMERLLESAAQKWQEDLTPYDVRIFIPGHIPAARRYQRTSNEPDRGWRAARPLYGIHQTKEVPLLRAPKLHPRERQGPAPRNWLIEYADQALRKGPKVFISCPSSAIEHRNILHAALEKNHWTVNYYDETTRSETTYTEARRLVADADYLVGIWLPDSVYKVTESAGEIPQISPWMHFELGQAVAFEREFKILADRSLPQLDVVRRIAADRPVLLFADMAEFEKKVKELMAFMDLNWRRQATASRSKSEDQAK